MTHLWSIPNSQRFGMSASVCGRRICDLRDDEVIREIPPYDCPACKDGEAVQKHFTGLTASAGLAAQEKAPVSAKAARISFLEKKREATKADLLLRFEDGDYHGVRDCASDLRDIESELKGLRT